MNFGLPKPRKVCRLEESQDGPQCTDMESLSGLVRVLVGGSTELLEVDPIFGPKVYTAGGKLEFFELKNLKMKGRPAVIQVPQKSWSEYTASERKVALCMAAKRNLSLRPLLDPKKIESPEDVVRRHQMQKALQDAQVAGLADRCDQERQRAVSWKPIQLDTVLNNHSKKAPGMFFGIEFPWSAESLKEMGPAWLTEAFQRAGTLEPCNRVTQIKLDDRKVTAGNNAGKFLFEVRYETDRPGLHKKLFAKVPHALTKETKQDRLSSSVLKQPMDFLEINTYRVAETYLPMKTPKFYYGDISNETSNYILITERIPFAELEGRKKGERLRPFEIEGPYDKCKDYELHGSGKEYYTLIMKMSAKLAAADKSFRMGSKSFLAANFGPNPAGAPPENFGVNLEGPSGDSSQATMQKLKIGIRFFSKTASMMFADYVQTEAFIQKFTRTMMLFQAYAREIDYWKHLDADFIALGHANLNVDNAYYWRDEQGKLDCGVLDWGGFGPACVGHKLYWYINCAEWDNNRDNLRFYVNTFVETYHEEGGPKIDPDTLEKMIKLTCLGNLMNMIAAVPDCLRQIPEGDWSSMRDRMDPRITTNLHGKSTLRTTLRAMDNGLRMIEELKVDQLLEEWIQEIWIKKLGYEAKSEDVIFAGPEAEIKLLEGRCERERKKPPLTWSPISIDMVLTKHDKVGPGICYGMEFPWSAKKLEEMGPAWLTKAFQKAGTLEASNRVVSIHINETPVTAGNNAGKFLFEVTYENERPGLHNKLFAKVPHAMTKETKQDRLSSSVLKQPMDYLEIHTYRVAETFLPMKTPKFYFGDISNETSNFILITERIPFAQFEGRKPGEKLQPFEIEGPYDKCKDYELEGSGKEYYALIMEMSGKLAAAGISGKMGTREFVMANFWAIGDPAKPEQWGLVPDGPSGGAPQETASKLKKSVQFFSKTASVLFADYVQTDAFIDKFNRTMMTFWAYMREIDYWKHLDPGYIALTHANLNVDNAYFWRDEEGRLDCGVLDWGGFGAACVGHKIYWYVNCAEWENNKQNLRFYLETFIKTYHEEGGPLLDLDKLEMMVKLTGLGNLMNMVAAVPDCMRQLPEKEWATIKDRMDHRITQNLHGKSTLRTTLRAMDNGLRFIEELQVDLLLEQWIDEIWVGELGKSKKTTEMIFGGTGLEVGSEGSMG